MHLRAVSWKQGEVYDFSNLDAFDGVEIVSVNVVDSKVNELEKALSELFDIPEDKLIILLRHEKGYNNAVSCEYFNMDWRKPKKISECSKFEHGQYLFVEEGDPAGNFNEFHWKQEI